MKLSKGPESQRARDPPRKRAREPKARQPESRSARQTESQRAREKQTKRAREPETQRPRETRNLCRIVRRLCLPRGPTWPPTWLPKPFAKWILLLLADNLNSLEIFCPNL